MADPTPVPGSKTSRFKGLVSRVKASVKKRLSKISKGQRTERQEEPIQEPSGQSLQTADPPSASKSKPSPPSESATKTPQTAERITFRTTVDKEKVQALFAKYGLEFDGESVLVSSLDKPGNRVEKPIRMRIRRECHDCNTTFSRSLICKKCEHRYCRDCRRYPPKKPKDKNKAKAGPGAATSSGTRKPDDATGKAQQENVPPEETAKGTTQPSVLATIKNKFGV